MARTKSLMPPGILQLLDGVPEATGEALHAARAAAGLTQAQAAALMGLSGAPALAKMEAGAGTDRTRLALLLLATGQHPALTVRPR